MTRFWRESDVGTRKVCYRCKLESPAEQFKSGNRVASYCSVCRKEIDRHRGPGRYQSGKTQKDAKGKEWRKNNPEVHKDINNRARRKLLKTPEGKAANRAMRKRWAELNPDKNRAVGIASRQRRKLRLVDDGTVTSEVIKSLLSKSKCAYCKRHVPKEFRTVDHIEPVARGGLHTASNLTMACGDCNSKKRDQPVEEFNAYCG